MNLYKKITIIQRWYNGNIQRRNVIYGFIATSNFGKWI